MNNRIHSTLLAVSGLRGDYGLNEHVSVDVNHAGILAALESYCHKRSMLLRWCKSKDLMS